MKKICLIIAFCFLISVILPIVITTVHAEEDEDEYEEEYEWTFEFEEFNDDCLVLSPQKQEMYMLNALTASYSSGITTYDNYMEIYYDNLTENLGNNYQGSCGYVAIGMLLSYYDTYINDSIIPDAYDIQGEGLSNNLIAWRDSPGVLRDIINDGRNLSASEYYNILKNQSGYSFHAKLITIGHRWGYYNYFSNYPAGTTFGMIMAVLDSYLKLYKGYSNAEYTMDYAYELIASEDNSVRDFVIEKIQSGQPVLLAVQGINENNKKEGHAVIAYDYNETTDQIYCHWGWGANKTHVTPESEGLTLYKAALTLDFDLPYSHAYNYIKNKDQPNEETYCSCYFSSHPEHECRYYKEYDSNYHQYVCGCSDELFRHNFVCDGTENEVHYVKCADCEYRVNKIEDPQYTSINSIQHSISCHTCGYTSDPTDHSIVYETLDSYTHGEHCTDCSYVEDSRPHEFVYSAVVGNRHKKSCLCGYSVTEGCMGRASIDGTSYCINCGREMAPFPEFFSLEDEEDALLMGIISDLPPDNKEDEYYSD